MIDGIIYKTVSRVSKKIYVGQTTHSLKRRIAMHLAQANRLDRNRSNYFYSALRKYAAGSSIIEIPTGYQTGSFLWFVVDHATTRKELNKKEKYWIKKLGCKVPNGYNSTDGGEDNPMNNPEIAAKFSGENNPMKRPEVVAKIRGENHPMFGRTGKNSSHWKGGKSIRRGYLLLRIPNHPLADHLGYVSAHRFTWEKHRGPIPPGKEVHFRDQSLKNVDKWGRRYRDSSIKNLYLGPFRKGGKRVLGGYLLLLKPNHPRANIAVGYVYAHIFNWIKYRNPIPKGKRVHFKDRSLKIVDKWGRRYRDPSIKNLYLWP